jgi:hypothetical protein
VIERMVDVIWGRVKWAVAWAWAWDAEGGDRARERRRDSWWRGWGRRWAPTRGGAVEVGSWMVGVGFGRGWVVVMEVEERDLGLCSRFGVTVLELVVGLVSRVVALVEEWRLSLCSVDGRGAPGRVCTGETGFRLWGELLVGNGVEQDSAGCLLSL